MERIVQGIRPVHGDRVVLAVPVGPGVQALLEVPAVPVSPPGPVEHIPIGTTRER
ncbi:MAG: hypothetical protein ACE5GH_01845 [Fidelibacterota bacterium]